MSKRRRGSFYVSGEAVIRKPGQDNGGLPSGRCPAWDQLAVLPALEELYAARPEIPGLRAGLAEKRAWAAEDTARWESWSLSAQLAAVPHTVERSKADGLRF